MIAAASAPGATSLAEGPAGKSFFAVEGTPPPAWSGSVRAGRVGTCSEARSYSGVRNTTASAFALIVCITNEFRGDLMLSSKDQLTICFAHVAYRLRERFLTLATGIESFEVRDGAALEQRIGEADVLVISGLWRNDLLPRAKRLRFIQSIGAGTDQFSREALNYGVFATGWRVSASSK